MSALVWPLLFLAVGLILLIAEVFIPSGGLDRPPGAGLPGPEPLAGLPAVDRPRA